MPQRFKGLVSPARTLMVPARQTCPPADRCGSRALIRVGIVALMMYGICVLTGPAFAQSRSPYKPQNAPRSSPAAKPARLPAKKESAPQMSPHRPAKPSVASPSPSFRQQSAQTSRPAVGVNPSTPRSGSHPVATSRALPSAGSRPAAGNAAMAAPLPRRLPEGLTRPAHQPDFRSASRPRVPGTSGLPAGKFDQRHEHKAPGWSPSHGTLTDREEILLLLEGYRHAMNDPRNSADERAHFWNQHGALLSLYFKLGEGRPSPMNGNIHVIPMNSPDEPNNSVRTFPLPPGWDGNSGGGQGGQSGQRGQGSTPNPGVPNGYWAGRDSRSDHQNGGGGGGSGGGGGERKESRITVSGPDPGSSRNDYENHKDKKSSNDKQSSNDKKDNSKDKTSDPPDKLKTERNKKEPQPEEGLPPDDGSGRGGNDMGARRPRQGARDNRSGIQQLHGKDVRTGRTKTGADDKERPDVGGRSGTVSQRNANPGNPDNDLRYGPSGSGGAQVPGWTDKVWWHLNRPRAQPGK